MYTIILYGDCRKSRIQETLVKCLSEEYHINVFREDSMLSQGNKKGTNINLIITNHLKVISIKNAVLILCNNSKIHNIKFIDSSIKIILPSIIQTKQLTKIIKFQCSIYSCGYSSKDYITFSSHDKDSAVVALQRSIMLSKKQYCDPFEIPCILSEEVADYTILSCILTLILIHYFDQKHLNNVTKIYL